MNERRVAHGTVSANGVVLRSETAGGVDRRNAGAISLDEEYLSALAPGFGGFVRDEVQREIADPGDRVGSSTAEAAGWFGPADGAAARAGIAPVVDGELEHEAVRS